MTAGWATAEDQVVYLYDRCSISAARGAAAAKQDIARGKLHIYVYLGAAPIPPSRQEAREAQLAIKAMQALGVEAEARMASDIVECDVAPYVLAYQKEMKAAIEAKFGKTIWHRVDAKVGEALGRSPKLKIDERT
jgi:hypothetical protein